MRALPERDCLEHHLSRIGQARPRPGVGGAMGPTQRGDGAGWPLRSRAVEL